MPWKRTDQFKVVGEVSPFSGFSGEVYGLDEGNRFPVLGRVSAYGEEYECAFAEDEIEHVDQAAPTEEIPVVVA